MKEGEKLKGRDEVLLACLNLDNSGKKEFTEWEITVEAWKINKSRFGLRGFEKKYPDHKRVHEVYVGRSWTEGILERIRENVYIITPTGRKVASEISGESDHRMKADIKLLNDLINYLNHVAFKYFQRGDAEKINWNQVASFYRINWNFPPNKNRSRIKELENILIESEKIIKVDGPDVLRREMNKDPITIDEIIELKKLHLFIQEKFKDEFKALLGSE